MSKRSDLQLRYEILEDFDDVDCTSDDREERHEALAAAKMEMIRAKDRERQARHRERHKERVQERERECKARHRAEVLAELRRLDGIGERVCARDGCTVVFPVMLHVPGRPQVYCCSRCALRAAWGAWKARWVK